MSIFESIVITLSIAVVSVSLLKRLHLPPILGYLLSGALVGPYALGILQSHEDLQFLAEFGIVFLLFAIGLELSFPKLIAMRKALLTLGGLQVLICTAIPLAIAHYTDISLGGAIAVAGALALSSTAVATKQLIEQNELYQPHGKMALSILLFQDLAAVPFLIIVPSMAATSDVPVSETLLNTLWMGFLVFVILLAAGRWLLRPLYHHIAHAKSSELLLLTTLLVVLASAFLTEHFGLSLALGAFLAGVMLAETEYVHQIEADIEPFKDILMGLFFITVGMLINIDVLIEDWMWVLLILVCLVVVKALIIAVLGLLTKTNVRTSIRSGLALAQGGEFGFAFLALAFERGLIDKRPNQIVITAIVLSICIAPILIRKNKQIADFFLAKFKAKESNKDIKMPEDHGEGLENHVIICGYGRVGQTLARFLEHEGIQFIGLDIDPFRIKEARAASEPVYYGNAQDETVLNLAGVKNARLVITSFLDPLFSQKVIRSIRRLNKEVPVLVRTNDDRLFEQLSLAGATEVIPEKLESSLMLASHMLLLLGTSVDKAQQKIWEVKSNRYKLLKGYFPGQDDNLHIEGSGKENIALHACELTDRAYAVGKTLEELSVDKMPIEIASFTRHGFKSNSPAPHTKLEAGDILVLKGTTDEIYLMEEKLLQG